VQPVNDPLLGKRLERYQINQRLGEGGMGMVYQARDLALQRDVAIKVLHTQVASLPQFQERFLQEARISARLDHPGIVKVFDFGVQTGLLYIVMEFIPGISLRQRLGEIHHQKTSMPLETALAFTIQVADALEYAHHMGVYHRDIKPDNIMLKPRSPAQAAHQPVPTEPVFTEQVVITDLGLAKLAEGGVNTITGVSLGTPAYMSPEQLQGQPASPSSDVYALGILLYEQLTLKPPFPVRTLNEAVRRVLEEHPPHPRIVRPDIPEALEDTILCALAKDPQLRFASAGETADALRDILAQLTQPTPAAPEPEAPHATIIEMPAAQPPAQPEPEWPLPGTDVLEVSLPSGETRHISIDADFYIGREKGNDLMLQDNKVSRRHARILHFQGRYQIEDLGSSNGTYLDQTRLEPNTRVDLLPGQEVTLGKTTLRLLPQKASTLILSPQDLADDEGYTSPAMPTPIPASVSPFTVEEEQPPAAFEEPVPDSPALVSAELMPAASDTSEPEPASQLPEEPFSALPTRATSSSEAPFEETRVSEAHSAEAYAIPPSLTPVMQEEIPPKPPAAFRAGLTPASIRPGQPGRVVIANNSLSAEIFRVSLESASGEVTFQPAQESLEIAPGNKGSLNFTVLPATAVPLLGKTRQVPYTARVWVQDGPSHTLKGEASLPPTLPVSPLAFVISLLVLGVAACLILSSLLSLLR
jgi:pSer/pThr/pTyr-binding forkhead associated (FHA) protein